jgi:hypothetical protein
VSVTVQTLTQRGSIPDEGVDLDGVNVVELLQGLLDLSLVGQSVDDEDQGVVLLDLLHGALGVERVDDDLVGIEMGLRGHRLARVLGLTRELEGLGLVEGRRETDLADLVGVDLGSELAMLAVFTQMGEITYALQRGLCGSAGLLARLGGSTCKHLRISNRS